MCPLGGNLVQNCHVVSGQWALWDNNCIGIGEAYSFWPFWVMLHHVKTRFIGLFWTSIYKVWTLRGLFCELNKTTPREANLSSVYWNTIKKETVCMDSFFRFYASITAYVLPTPDVLMENRDTQIALAFKFFQIFGSTTS